MKRLGHLSLDEFLQDYWQKKPVVLKQVFPDFVDPITPEEVAGLALEEEVESRLIEFLPGNQSWSATQGPICESKFLTLPESHWTLLVQTLEHWIPEAEALFLPFSFVPGWRRDDLMVSYATPEGGVGPHIDQYDVFLIQGSGSRLWRVGQPGAKTTPKMPHRLLKQIEPFDAIIECTLETGDVLYIPPNTAHEGIALQPCLTYSVGFRAPSHQSLLEQLLIEILEQDESVSTRYQEQTIEDFYSLTSLPAHTLKWARAALQSITDKQLLTAFGQLVTQPKYPNIEPEEIPLPEIRLRIKSGKYDLFFTPHARICETEIENKIILFIDGISEDFELKHRSFIQKFIMVHKISAKELKNLRQDIDFINAIANLIHKGACFLSSETETNLVSKLD